MDSGRFKRSGISVIGLAEASLEGRPQIIRTHNAESRVLNTPICTVCDEEIKPYYMDQKARKGNQGMMIVHKKCQSKVNRNIARETNKGRAIFRKYGITMGHFYDMMVSQSGQCKICGIAASGQGVRLAIDHCHKTGKIRGLLCGKCNSMLGFANDNANILTEAARYLKDNQ